MKLETTEDLKAFRTLVRLTGPTFMGNISARYSSGFASITIFYLFLLTFLLVSSLDGGATGAEAGASSHDGDDCDPPLYDELAASFEGASLFESVPLAVRVLFGRAGR